MNTINDSNFPPEFTALWQQVAPFSMTSPERGFALWCAVNTVISNNIPGAFVECGVWKGGSSMLIALTLLQRGAAGRALYLFDTFDGMTPPGPEDIDLNGEHAADLMAGSRGADIADLVKAAVSLQDVTAAIASTGYDMRLVRLVKGDVSLTLPLTQTLRICLLRLDTDFYDSTLAELRHLYPRLAPGGPLIIDDYGHWQGARQAVEDYFADPVTEFARPALWAIDYTGRGGVKVENAGNVEIARYDYLPPGIAHPPNLLPLFTHALPMNPWLVQWQYLRPHVPHIFRSDDRNPIVTVIGNASVEEAACLYALAAMFRGKRGIEIGSHFGWTGAHLLAAGLELDCIDPAFATPAREAAVREVFDAINGAPAYRLWAGFSPGLLKHAHAAAPGPWSFAFIDGDHDGDAPRDDASAIIEYLADDAVVVFHDLTSPHVEQGLAVLRAAGFSTTLFNTMQILGVAWRGAVVPPVHVPDPNVPANYFTHLAKYL